MPLRATPWLVLLAVMLASCSGAADLVVVSVQNLGVMETPATIDGRDGGTSGRFMGRSVWVYGDTVATAKGTFPTTWRNNSMSWTADLDGTDGITGFVQPEDSAGAAREFFPRTKKEASFNAAHVDVGDGTCAEPCGARYAIWGSGPIDDPERSRALLIYGKVYSEPGAFNFSILGTSIAVWEDFDAGPTRPKVNAGLDDPNLLFDSSEGEFGIPAVADGYLYLFSCSGGPHNSNGCRLGRAKMADVLERSAWAFRTGNGWSPEVGSAVALFSGSPNMTVHWNEHLGRWLAVYMDWGKIVARTAKRIEGPWSDPTTVFVPRTDNPLHALAHAEYQERDGAVEYISYLDHKGFSLLSVRLEPPP